MKKRINLLSVCLLLALTVPNINASDNVKNSETKIIGHWNYPANSVNPIFVISDGEDVELLINGISFGHGNRENDSLFRFDNVIFQPGDLTAVSYDCNGNELSRQTLQTAGKPAQLILTVDPNAEGFSANGEDTAVILFQVADFQGKICGADERLVSFDIEGPAEWIGKITPEGCVPTPDKEIKAEYGTNRALIRSTKTPGEIKVTARAKGLAPVSATLNSKPSAAVD